MAELYTREIQERLKQFEMSYVINSLARVNNVSSKISQY